MDQKRCAAYFARKKLNEEGTKRLILPQGLQAVTLEAEYEFQYNKLERPS